MICGIANGAVVQRPVQLRKFCWNSNTRPIEQTAHERERQALQATDDRGRERRQDQQGERLDVEGGELLGEEDAGDRGHRRAERPREHRHAAGLDAVEAGELAVVDDRAHRDAEARAGEQDLEAERETEADDDGDEARPRHERVADLEAAGAEEAVDVARLLRVPDQAGEAHEGEHETDRW